MNNKDGDEKFIRQEFHCWCIWFHIGIFTWHFNLKLKLKIYVKLNFKLETYVIKKINLVLVIFCRIFRRQLRPTHPWLRVEGIVNYYLPVSLRPSWWCFNYQRLLSSFAVQLYLRKFCHRSWPPSWSTSCRFPCPIFFIFVTSTDHLNLFRTAIFSIAVFINFGQKLLRRTATRIKRDLLWGRMSACHPAHCLTLMSSSWAVFVLATCNFNTSQFFSLVYSLINAIFTLTIY